MLASTAIYPLQLYRFPRSCALPARMRPLRLPSRLRCSRRRIVSPEFRRLGLHLSPDLPFVAWRIVRAAGRARTRRAGRCRRPCRAYGAGDAQFRHGARCRRCDLRRRRQDYHLRRGLQAGASHRRRPSAGALLRRPDAAAEFEEAEVRGKGAVPNLVRAARPDSRGLPARLRRRRADRLVHGRLRGGGVRPAERHAGAAGRHGGAVDRGAAVQRLWHLEPPPAELPAGGD